LGRIGENESNKEDSSSVSETHAVTETVAGNGIHSYYRFHPHDVLNPDDDAKTENLVKQAEDNDGIFFVKENIFTTDLSIIYWSNHTIT
jgi:hypothetical protein